MEQTIRQILELDAAAETRLQASRMQCRSKIKEARAKADAIRQAQEHHTRDLIIEFEEQTRTETEQKTARLNARYEKQADAAEQQLAVRHDALLDALFADTLRSAAE